jgi:hypothetical protein
MVGQELLARNEYLAAENRILKGLSLPNTPSRSFDSRSEANQNMIAV